MRAAKSDLLYRHLGKGGIYEAVGE